MFDRESYDKLYYRKNKERRLKWNKEWRKANAAFIAEYKIGKSCSCGESHPACLEFHHRDGETKKFNISDAVGRYGINRLKEEIEKCELLCANCHRKLHFDGLSG